MTDKQPEEKQVPLYELLEDVPEDFRIGFKDNDNWSAGVTWHPIGVMCHQAAAKLRRLHEVNAELVEALQGCLVMLERANCSTGYCCCGMRVDTHGFGDGHSPVDEGDYHQSNAVERASAAIAKATGEQQ